jgi:hypothetical protein
MCTAIIEVQYAGDRGSDGGLIRIETDTDLETKLNELKANTDVRRIRVFTRYHTIERTTVWTTTN